MQRVTTSNRSQGRLRLNHVGSGFCSLNCVNTKESLFGLLVELAHAQLQPDKDVQFSEGTSANRRGLLSSLNLRGKVFCRRQPPERKIGDRNPQRMPALIVRGHKQMGPYHASKTRSHLISALAIPKCTLTPPHSLHCLRLSSSTSSGVSSGIAPPEAAQRLRSNGAAHA